MFIRNHVVKCVYEMNQYKKEKNTEKKDYFSLLNGKALMRTEFLKNSRSTMEWSLFFSFFRASKS